MHVSIAFDMPRLYDAVHIEHRRGKTGVTRPGRTT